MLLQVLKHACKPQPAHGSPRPSQLNRKHACPARRAVRPPELLRHGASGLPAHGVHAPALLAVHNVHHLAPAAVPLHVSNCLPNDQRCAQDAGVDRLCPGLERAGEQGGVQLRGVCTRREEKWQCCGRVGLYEATAGGWVQRVGRGRSAVLQALLSHGKESSSWGLAVRIPNLRRGSSASSCMSAAA